MLYQVIREKLYVGLFSNLILNLTVLFQTRQGVLRRVPLLLHSVPVHSSRWWGWNNSESYRVQQNYWVPETRIVLILWTNPGELCWCGVETFFINLEWNLGMWSNCPNVGSPVSLGLFECENKSKYFQKSLPQLRMWMEMLRKPLEV